MTQRAELPRLKDGPPVRRQRARAVAEFFIPLVLLGVGWELVGRLGMVQREIVPYPSGIAQRLWEMVRSGVLFHHVSQSMYRLAVGYAFAAVLGIAVGALLAIQKTARQMFSPILSMLISVPTIAWVPLLLLTTGLGDRTVISTIFLGSFFAIAYNTMRGVQLVNRNLICAARVMGIQRIKLFTTVLLPSSLVSIIAGLRLGIGYSWRALVGGEMLSALVEWGVGKMIYQARFWNDTAAMFVGLLTIGATGLLLDRLFLDWLERRTVEKWGMVTER